MKEYLEGRNLITKLQAKHDLLQKTLGESECGLCWRFGSEGRPSPGPKCWARTSILSQADPVWLYECIVFPRSFDVEAHAPNDRLSNGEGPMLNEALMCIIYLFKWSVPALHPAPLLRLLCHCWGQGAGGFFTVQTLWENSQLLCSGTQAEARRWGAVRWATQLLWGEKRRGFSRAGVMGRMQLSVASRWGRGFLLLWRVLVLRGSPLPALARLKLWCWIDYLVS